MNFNTNNGVVSGTPLAPANTTLTFQATDSSQPTGTTVARSFNFSIAPAKLVLATGATLAAASVGTGYSATLAATGGTTPYHWSVVTGTLPVGLVLNGTTGALTGTPTSARDATFAIQVKDSGGMTAMQSFNLVVQPSVRPGVYVVNEGNDAVLSFNLASGGDIPPHSMIAGAGAELDGASAVVVGPMGEIYVANSDNNSVTEYPNQANGPTKPDLTISGAATRLDDPRALALDASGDLYVANSSTITEYAPGAGPNASPIATITGVMSPDGLTVAPNGTVWVASLTNAIYEYAPGPNHTFTPGTVLFGPATGLAAPSGLAIDGAGNLLVADTDANRLTEYSLSGTGYPFPLRTITCGYFNFPTGLDVDSQGNIYVSNKFGNSIVELPPNAGYVVFATATISGPATGLSAPALLAVTPPLAIVTEQVPAATLHRPYHFRFRAALGRTPYRWTVRSGHLPLDLVLNRQTGTLQGRPLAQGAFRFAIEATDGGRPRMTATHEYLLMVRAKG